MFARGLRRGVKRRCTSRATRCGRPTPPSVCSSEAATSRRNSGRRRWSIGSASAQYVPFFVGELQRRHVSSSEQREGDQAGGP
jgi:hypothetical protein